MTAQSCCPAIGPCAHRHRLSSCQLWLVCPKLPEAAIDHPHYLSTVIVFALCRQPAATIRRQLSLTHVCVCQLSALELLERENEAAGQRLQEVVARGELLLRRIQEALHDIAQSQLDTQLLLAGQRPEQ